MRTTVRFDGYEVDLPAGQLYKHGIRINLRDKSFQVLAALLEHPGEVVTREDLRRLLWREEVFVDFDNNLNTAIARLREALGDSADHPRFIETLPKRGYRFLENVFQPPRAPGKGRATRVRLLVLPFVNLSGDPAEEHFSDAMTDEIITQLANLAPDCLAVIARTTAMHYKGTHKDVARISRELGVDYILEGGVRRTNDHVVINAQLIQAADQTHVFAKRFDAELGDIFQVEGCLVEEVAANVPSTANGVSFRAARRDAARRPTKDAAAYNAYIQGRYHLNKYTREGLAKAKQCFEEALARDPNFALANDGLAEHLWLLGFNGFAAPKEVCSMGMFYALRALEIDNGLAETHALIGVFRKELDYNWQEVQRDMARALELGPASPVVRFRYALSGLMPLGRLQEAIAEFEGLLESDPLSLINRFWLTAMLWLARDFGPALEQARRAVELYPANSLSYLALGQVRTMQHFFTEAIPALERADELSEGSPTFLGWLGLALAQGGETAEARGLLKRLHALAAQRYVPPTSFAWIHLGLSEIDDAFLWMDRAIEARDPMMTPIKSYVFLDPLRGDPRFAGLLGKMNLL